MNNDKIIIDNSLLVSYAKGVLLGNAAKKMREALEKDRSLQIRYEAICILLREYPDKDPIEIIDSAFMKTQVHLKKIPDKKPLVVSIWRKYRIIALAAACISVVFFIWKEFSESQIAPVQVAQNFIAAEKYPLPELNERGETINTPGSGLNGNYEWLDDYKLGNYEDVIQKLLTEEKRNTTENFYLGYSYLKSQKSNPGQAVVYLSKVTDDIFYGSDAYYYIGSAQLILGKKRQAEESLSKSKHPHAAELLTFLRQ